MIDVVFHRNLDVSFEYFPFPKAKLLALSVPRSLDLPRGSVVLCVFMIKMPGMCER